MRLFLALPIPQAEREKIARLQNSLGRGRMVHVDDLHITSVFLGNGSPPLVDELVGALDGLNLALPRIKLAGPGVFGRDQPRAAWLGVAPTAPLETLHKKLVRHAQSVGFDVPKRKYMPHITLARFAPSSKSDTQLAGIFESIDSSIFEPFQPLAMTLYQSMLGREAPIYDALFSFPVSPL